MSLGKRIKELRKKLGKTQGDIGNHLGMGRSNVGHIENDRVIPSSSDLNKIADLLNTTPNYLLGKTSDPSPKSDSWIAKQNKLDFKKMLEEEVEITFDGVPLSDKDRDKIKKVMEAILLDTKDNE